MCGIYGTLNLPARIAAKLGAENDARGTDSCGILTYAPDAPTNRYHVLRALGSTRALLKRSDLTATFLAAPVVLGHTRAATTGAVTIRCAHPFKRGSIVGAHNGIIANWRTVAADNALEGIQVDSEVIFALLDVLPPSKVFPQLEGWAACWWVDRRDPSVLHLYRDGAPLHLATLHKRPALAFSSDLAHLRRALKRAHVGSYAATSLGCDGTHVTLSLSTGEELSREHFPLLARWTYTTTSRWRTAWGEGWSVDADCADLFGASRSTNSPRRNKLLPFDDFDECPTCGTECEPNSFCPRCWTWIPRTHHAH